MSQYTKVVDQAPRKVIHYVCDECGSESTHRKHRCEMCMRDICGGCEGGVTFQGDSTIYFCQACWDMRLKYLPGYRDMQRRHEEEKSAKEAACWKECCTALGIDFDECVRQPSWFFDEH